MRRRRAGGISKHNPIVTHLPSGLILVKEFRLERRLDRRLRPPSLPPSRLPKPICLLRSRNAPSPLVSRKISSFERTRRSLARFLARTRNERVFRDPHSFVPHLIRTLTPYRSDVRIARVHIWTPPAIVLFCIIHIFLCLGSVRVRVRGGVCLCK